MLKIDLHLHTVASKHAHSTINEYIQQAKKLGMTTIDIADHGYGNKSTLTDNAYFSAITRIPGVVDGIRVLKGTEANIIDENGLLDIKDETLERLDFVIANIHLGTDYKDLGSKANAESVCRAIKSGKVHMISHPFTGKFFDFDFEKVYETACENNVLLELNLSYLVPGRIEECLEDLKLMVDVVKNNGKKLIINSDSHNMWELGDDTNLEKIRDEIGLTDEMIINNYPEELFKFLKNKAETLVST